MKNIVILTLALAISTLVSQAAHANSWYYNENGGFGIYQPLGWSVEENGRSSRLVGPSRDSDQTEIFIGSDWNSKIRTLSDLEKVLRKEFPGEKLIPVDISELQGYKLGDERKGSMHVLRVSENVIVIEYDLRGSKDQIEEGETALSSIEIRTRPTPFALSR